MNKYFGYIRVSTAKQGERSVSLPEQRAAIERHALKNNLVLADWFEERQTAAKKGRPVWSHMLKALRHGKAKGVVIHKIDRSARNLKDWADLGELIDQGIEVHFANESLDLNSRGGRLSADIQAVVAADYIRNLREETIKGFFGRLRQGFYPLRAPLGYRDNGAGKAKTIDPVTGPLVRKTFELYLTGRYSLHALRDEMFRLGLRNKAGSAVTLNGLSTILNNPFYTGLIRIRRTNQTFQGNHEPLIAKHAFDTVQDILQGRFRRRSFRHEFLFRRLIKCKECGSTLVGELKKGHVYYRCHTRTCTATGIREEAVEQEVMNGLRALEFADDEKRYLAGAVQELKRRWIADREQSLRNLVVRKESLTERLNRLTDAFLDGTIDKALFEDRKTAILSERQKVQDSITTMERNERSIPELVGEFLERAGSAFSLYQTGLLEQKRRMVKTVSSNLVMHEKKVELTYRIPFGMIATREKCYEGSPCWVTARTMAPIVQHLVTFFSEHPIPIE